VLVGVLTGSERANVAHRSDCVSRAADPGDGAASRTMSPFVSGLFRCLLTSRWSRSRAPTAGLRSSTYVSPTVKDQ